MKKLSFTATIAREFAFLKGAEDLEGVFARGIRLPQLKGLLLPAGRVNLGSVPPGGRPADAPDRILFLVYDADNQLIDRLGLACVEGGGRKLRLDPLPNGLSSPAGQEAVVTLAQWARRTLWPDQIGVAVDLADRPTAAALQRLEFIGGSALADGQREFLAPALPPGRRAGDELILTAGPSIAGREATYALDAVKYGWNGQWGTYLKKFEAAFAGYVGAKHALATSSCTGALHIALQALGIGPGDEVIVPDITWVATANAVLYVGATPVFADVQPGSWCLDPESFAKAITPRTRAVIPVHLYGHPCEMDKILEIAARSNLYVVEDAAPSIGAEFRGRRTGSFGHFACFSFQGAKLAVTGEGGMLVTSDEALFEKAHRIWDQGRKPGTFWIESNGLKYKLANPLAAIGLGQLERNDEMVAAKRRIFSWYEAGLQDIPHLALNREMPWAHSIYWMSSLLVADTAPISRDELIKRLKSRNVDTRPVFPAISQYPIWPRRQAPQPQAHRIGCQAINLPSGVCLAEEEVAYVCGQIREILAEFRPETRELAAVALTHE